MKQHDDNANGRLSRRGANAFIAVEAFLAVALVAILCIAFISPAVNKANNSVSHANAASIVPKVNASANAASSRIVSSVNANNPIGAIADRTGSAGRMGSSIFGNGPLGNWGRISSTTDGASNSSSTRTVNANSDESAGQGTLAKTIRTVDGRRYTVKVDFDAAAGIPDGSKLEVVEFVQEPIDPNWENDPAYADRPLATEQFQTEQFLQERTDVAANSLAVNENERIFFNKFLSLQITHNGAVVEPAQPVVVTLTTTNIYVDASDAIWVTMFARDDLAATDEQTIESGLVTNDGKVVTPLAVTNLTNVTEGNSGKTPADSKMVKLQFTTADLDELGLIGIVEQNSELWEKLVRGEGPSAASESAAVSEGSEYAGDAEGSEQLVYVDGAEPGDNGIADSDVEARAADAIDAGAQSPSDSSSAAEGATAATQTGEQSASVNGGLSAEVSGEHDQAANAQSSNDSPLAGGAASSGDDASSASAEKQGTHTGKGSRLIDTVGDSLANVATAVNPSTTDSANSASSARSANTAGSSDTAGTPRSTDADNAAGTASSTSRSKSAARATDPSITTLTKSVPDVNGNSYGIAVSFGPEAGIPEGAKLQVRELLNLEYMIYLDRAAQVLDSDSLAYVRGFDIAIIGEDGREVEPQSPVDVSISLGNAPAFDETNVLHFGGGSPDVIAPEVSTHAGGSTFDFTAESFSTYIVTGSVHDQALQTSDGQTYKVSVSYDYLSGIPANAEVVVREIGEGDEGYASYTSETLRKLGVSSDNVSFVKAFDIALVNPRTGERYQPNNNVKVSIELLDESVDDRSKVEVVHFGRYPKVMDTTMSGTAVEFETDGFSVYTATGVKTLTYRFWQPSMSVEEWTNGPTEYMVSGGESSFNQVTVTTDAGGTTEEQIVKNNERPVVPELPAQNDKVFAGWYKGRVDSGTVYYDTTPYDFDSVNITESATVNLYARFVDYAYVVFHDQYNSELSDFPIAATRRAEKTSGSNATVNISDVVATYTGDEKLAFYGWSRTPITTPGAVADDKGQPVDRLAGDSISVTEGNKVDLYPIFKPYYQLTFAYSNEYSAASYVTPIKCFEGVGPTSLPVPTLKGYSFMGWHLHDGTNGTVGTEIANENGAFTGVTSAGISFNGTELLLSQDVTVYGEWLPLDNVAYKVAVWKQKISDAQGLTDANKSYDLVQLNSHITPVGTARVSVDESTYHPTYVSGYTRARYDQDVALDPEGNTVLNVYYDMNPSSTYTPQYSSYLLTFKDSVTNGIIKDSSTGIDISYPVGYNDNLLTGNSGSSYIPAAPTPRAGYAFSGWYADQSCSVRAFFDKTSYNNYDGAKVLYTTMPDMNLDLYAGWEPIQYLVELDPNHGSFDGTGTGRTWYWETIEGNSIPEYAITRDYKPSSSGTYFYRKLDRAYYGYTDDKFYDSESSATDRNATYVENPGLATEDATYESAPGTYTYAGWYEVAADGTETPYEFGQQVDHNTKLKLHWKKDGVYYVAYNAAVSDGGTQLEGTVSNTAGVDLDQAYADSSVVTVNASATPPNGYVFAGWKIRGDKSAHLYKPGQTFTLDATYANTVGGKETVTLDAVYTRVGTASITYDANGGTLSADSVDFGEPLVSAPQAPTKTTSGSTATIANLRNNSSVKLSDGTGFTREGMTFAGWSLTPNHRAGDTLYEKGGTYNVDTNAPTTLYAVWQVRVYYHVTAPPVEGRTPENVTWSVSGTDYPYDSGVGAYYQNVYLGDTVSSPTVKPTYSDTGDHYAFDYWALGTSVAAGTTVYDFSSSVTGDVHLYMTWKAGSEDSVKFKAHWVNASNETIVEGAESTPVLSAEKDILVGDSGVLLSEQTAPIGGYSNFAVAKDPNASWDTVSEDNAITKVYFKPEANNLYVTYLDTNKPDAPLGENEDVYFVYYQQKSLDIRYKGMSTLGGLIDLNITHANAPHATGALYGVYDLPTSIGSPMLWTGGYSSYAYAIGPTSATGIADFCKVTSARNGGFTPALAIRNTWRGLQYSVDGTTWINCGYDVALYVVYFQVSPSNISVVTLQEKTVSDAASKHEAFTYGVTVSRTPSDSQSVTYNLAHGESRDVVLFYDASSGTAETQTISIHQTAVEGFATSIDSAVGETTDSYTWSYTTAAPAESTDPYAVPDSTPVSVTFTNTQNNFVAEVHVALMDVANGTIVLNDTSRSSDHTISLDPTNSKSKSFTNTLLPMGEDGLFNDTTGTYAFGAVVYGSDNGSVVTVNSLDAASVALEQESDGSYGLVVKDSGGAELGNLDANKVYYLYYPKPKVKYVKEADDGSLTAVKGSNNDGTSAIETITYNRQSFEMNGSTVSQDQAIEFPAFPLESYKISQEASATTFRMPPVLDDGTKARALVYAKLGTGPADATSLSALAGSSNVGVTDGLTMFVKVVDNTLKWSFTNTDGDWHAFTSQPTVYAIYVEQGYDLQISKTIPAAEGAPSDGREFTVTVTSPAIKKASYAVDGIDGGTIAATPATTTESGRITFPIRGGQTVRLFDLGQGTYTVKETDNQNYALSATSGPIGGAATDADVVNNTVTLDIAADTSLGLVNTPRYICKITDGAGEHPFYTLHDAIEYAKSQSLNNATIEMLADYLMAHSDVAVVPANYNITLKTAATSGGTYNYVGTGSQATITRAADFTKGSLLTNNGTLTVNNLTIDGNKVPADSALITNNGALSIKQNSILRNGVNVSGDGGAVYAGENATVDATATFSGNSAANGGAIYYAGSSTLNLSMSRFQNNTASNGGAVYATGGTIGLLNATFQDNIASASGGALYFENGTVTYAGSSSSGNKAHDGGAIYAKAGTLTISGNAHLDDSTALGGHGGALYLKSASAKIEGAYLQGNKAVSGNGGAIYVDSGSVDIASATIGGSIIEYENHAQNGSAVYVNTGTGTFSNAQITGNYATDGGAIGVGSNAARLIFSRAAYVSGNMLQPTSADEPVASNVYLDKDSDSIINAEDLLESANVGIYVPGSYDSELFKKRGGIGATFATFAGESAVSAFKNDRVSNLETAKDTAANKVYWSKTIPVEVRYLASYATSFPPDSSLEKVYENSTYAPVSDDAALSEVADDLHLKYGFDVGTAVFGAAFAPGGDGLAYYSDYLTRLFWDYDAGAWKVEKRDGSIQMLGERRIDIYYSDAAYLTIENNTNYGIVINPLTVTASGGNAQNVINTSSQYGYGLVYAKDDLVQTALKPVQGDASGNYTLAAGESVIILLPGGRVQYYSLNGKFETTDSNSVRVKNGAAAAEYVMTSDPITLNGQLPNSDEACKIVFGEDKPICKIVDARGENTFSTLTTAQQYATSQRLANPAIEMLVDYLVPADDVLAITDDDTFSSITLTTAKSGTYFYKGTGNATMSRASSNAGSALIDATRSFNNPLEVRIADINFNGKSLMGATDGGALKTKYCKVNIANASFENFIARNGGAVFANYGDEIFDTDNFIGYDVNYGFDYANYASVTVQNATFKNCEARSVLSRQGGGAIWTNAATLSVTGSTFASCKSNDQGGAIFHRIETERGPAQLVETSYASESRTTISSCEFTNCEASANTGSGGGIESDAHVVTVNDSTFTNCKAITGQGGGINTFIFEAAANTSMCPAGSLLTVSGCTFSGCSAAGDGGGVHSTMNTTTLQNSSFANCTAENRGGAAACSNGDANANSQYLGTSMDVLGCAITMCSTATGAGGGGIYAQTNNLTLGDYNYTDENNVENHKHTRIAQCFAYGTNSNGGGIFHDTPMDDSNTVVTNASIVSCTANVKGGGVMTNAANVTLTGATIDNCVSTSEGSDAGGGGMYVADKGSGTTTLDGSVVRGNQSKVRGGGMYVCNNLALVNGSRITGNRLVTHVVDEAAGVYLVNGKTFTIGASGASEPESSTIDGNLAGDGVKSNLRLPEANSGVNSNSVIVNCSLNGHIGVVNAKITGTQFGTSNASARPIGLSDSDSMFRSDNNGLLGIIDRGDSSGKAIVWAGPPICKLTDGAGNLLYFNTEGREPAVFDKLDNSGDGMRTSPFSYLRATNPTLYTKNGDAYAGNEYQVMMLVETYTIDEPCFTSTSADETDYCIKADWVVDGRKITFTTAGNDADYPYKGTPNTFATVKRGSGDAVKDACMIKAAGVFDIKNITLDAGWQGGTQYIGGDARVLDITGGSSVVTLGENAKLIKGRTSKSGGAAYVYEGLFVVDGGMIADSIAQKNGGGVYVGTTGQLDFRSGSIARCTVYDGFGGGVYTNATFNMSGGAIEDCSARKGGGVYVANSGTMNMSGGSIQRNGATIIDEARDAAGGGIAVDAAGAKLNFSGAPYVSDNVRIYRSGREVPNNVCVDVADADFNSVITSKGLGSGARIGVFVPGTATDDATNLYGTHGTKGMPFGTYESGSRTDTLYGFVNDRNGLSGGLNDGQGASDTSIYWVESYSLKVSKEVQSYKTEGDSDVEFSFDVELSGTVESSDGTIAAASVTTPEVDPFKYGDMKFNEGKATVTLKSGEFVTARHLPKGLTYTVTENMTDEQATSFAAVSGDVLAGEIGKDAGVEAFTSNAEFVNSRMVCKITSVQYEGDMGEVEEGRLLYYTERDASGTVSAYRPAVFGRLSDAFEMINNTSTSMLQIPRTTEGYSTDGHYGQYSPSQFRIELLGDSCLLTQPVTVTAGKEITLTTALRDPVDGKYRFEGAEDSTTGVVSRNHPLSSMITVANGGTLNLGNVTIDGSKDSNISATADGGIVHVANGATFAMGDGAALRNSATSGNGGAVYVEQGGTARVTGGTINNNAVVGDNKNGAGIYLAEGSKLYLSGNPNFGGVGVTDEGDLNTNTGNITNGNRRQDIYIEGYSGAEPSVPKASSLVVDGNIGSGPGTIWVWAEGEGHYKVTEQFAEIAEGVELNEDTYKAFRNARSDEDTGNETGSYLYGTPDGPTGSTMTNVIYWSGDIPEERDVVVRKVSQSYGALKNAAFTIYRGASTDPYVVRKTDGDTVTTEELASLTSDATGVIWSGKLPDGIYYMHETGFPARVQYDPASGKWYTLTVNEQGITCSAPRDSRT